MGNADLTESELLKGCITGDKRKWDIFVKRYNRLIYHTIHKTFLVSGASANPEDVNDLFQDAFTSFCADDFKKLRRFDPEKGCSLPSWLRMITVRMTIDHLRKRKPLVSIDDLPASTSQTGDQEVIIDKESMNYLRKLLKELPPKDKLLVELSYMRELPPEEVAQILQISVGAFYTRKNRIIGRLKKIAADENIM